tara:strand:- start:3379 stop:3948 length:570 start_codon:yes stop_codon:yes gene_type:complete
MSTYFNESNVIDANTSNFIIQKVVKYSSATETYQISSYTKKSDLIFIKYNTEIEAKIYVGDCDTCGWDLTKAQYDNATWGDILYLGLHLGVTPDYIYNNKSITSIDVVESNTSLVDHVNWINSNINVVKHDEWTYVPANNKTYDIIICDLWAEPDDITQDNKTNLTNHYSSHLKAGGKIIIPISGETIS